MYFHEVARVLLGGGVPEVLHSYDYPLECQWEIKMQNS